MYFPYVRGRQYELLALKELIMTERLSEHITPILEPVKLSSTLSKTMEEFVKRNRNLCVICNPAVGSFNSDMNDELIEQKDIWNLQQIFMAVEYSQIAEQRLMSNADMRLIIEEFILKLRNLK